MKGEPGTIRIKSFLQNDELHLIVWDNGVGMTKEQIEHELGQSRLDGDIEGFGLRGTIDRIRFYCGKDDVIFIESEPGEYTKVEMIIPTGTNEVRTP